MKKPILYTAILIFLAVASYADSGDDLLNSYIGYWKLEENGFNYTDVHSNNNNFTGGNSPDREASMLDFGQEFVNANTDYIYTSDTSDFELTNVTLSFWLKVNDVRAGSSYLFSFAERIVATNYGYSTDFDADAQFQAWSYGAAGDHYCRLNNNFSIGVWQHIAVAYADGGEISIYVNGTNQTDVTCNGNVGAKQYSAGNMGLSFGDLYWAGAWTGATPNCDVDELSIYNWTLPTTEIQYLYNGGTPTSAQQPPFGSNLTVVLDYPTNRTHYNHQPGTSWNGTIILNTTASANCTLNNTNFTLNQSTGTYHKFYNNTAINSGNYSIEWRCNDTATTWSNSTFWVYVDLVNPVITPTEPANGSYFNTDFDIDATFYDVFLYRASLNITNVSGHSVYSNYSGDLGGGDLWYNISYTTDNVSSWNGTCTVTGCNYTINYSATDTHTAKVFDENLNLIEEQAGNNREYTFILSKGDITITMPADINVSVKKNIDRFRFTFETEKIAATKILFIEAESIDYLPLSPFPGHFVINGAYWLDFVGDDFEIINIYKEEEKYKIKFKLLKKTVNTDSLGGLNFVTLTSWIMVDHSNPEFVSNTTSSTGSRAYITFVANEDVNYTYGFGSSCTAWDVSNSSYATYNNNHTLMETGLNQNTTYYANITIYDRANNTNNTCINVTTGNFSGLLTLNATIERQTNHLEGFCSANESDNVLFAFSYRWLLDGNIYDSEYNLENSGLNFSVATGWYNDVEYYNSQFYVVTGDDDDVSVYSASGTHQYTFTPNLTDPGGAPGIVIYGIAYNSYNNTWLFVTQDDYIHVTNLTFNQTASYAVNMGSCSYGATVSGVEFYNNTYYVAHYTDGVITKYNHTGGCVGLARNISLSVPDGDAIAYDLEFYNNAFYVNVLDGDYNNLIFKLNDDLLDIVNIYNYSFVASDIRLMGGIDVYDETVYTGTDTTDDLIISFTFNNLTQYNLSDNILPSIANYTPSIGGNWSFSCMASNYSLMSFWNTSNTTATPYFIYYIYNEQTGELITDNVTIYFISDELEQNIKVNFSGGSAIIDYLNFTDYTILYTADDYNQRHYFLEASDIIVNGTYYLFLLNESVGEFALIRVIDQNLNSVDNAKVTVKKNIPNFDTKQTISILQTNFEGEATLDFVLHTDNYVFVVDIAGVTVLTSTETQVSKEVLKIQIPLTVDYLLSGKIFTNSTGYPVIANYTTSDKICRYAYINLNSKENCLRLYERTLTDNDIMTQEECSTATSGTLSIEFNVSNSTLYICQSWIDTNTTNSWMQTGQDTFRNHPGKAIFGLFGVFATLAIILTLAFMFRESVAMLIIAACGGLILAYLASFIAIPWGGLVLIVLVGAFLAFKVRQ